MSQETLDITTYCTKMKRLWEELSTLHVKTQCSCSYTCRAKESVFKVEQDRRLIQYLMGLSEVYTARSNILMMNPLSSLAQTFLLLVQDKKQREIKPTGPSFMESASLPASSSGKRVMELTIFSVNSSTGARTFRPPRQNYPSTSNANFRTNYSQHSTYNGIRPRMICDYGKRPRHTREKCYKLHGYP